MQTEQGTAEQGTTEQGTTEQGTTEQGTTEQGTAEQGTTEQGTTEQGTAEQGTTDLINGEGDDNQDAAVIEYKDFTLPEGMELDAELLGSATPLFQELKLTQEQAQKFVDLQSQYVQDVETKQIEAFEKVKSDWANEVKMDPEMGGDNLQKTVKEATDGFKAVGLPGIFKLFKDYGIGNHPDMVRLGLKLNQMTREDSPGNTGNASTVESDALKRLYPNMVVEN